MQEQERYMDSIEAKSNAFKESIKKLWLQIISSDFIKGALDQMTSFVQWLSTLDGSVIKLVASFAGLGLALKSVATFSNTLKTVGSISKLGKEAGTIGKLVGGFTSLGGAIKSATTASLSFIATPLGVCLTALGVACVGAYTAYKSYQSIMSKPVDTPVEELSAVDRVVNSLTGNTIKSRAELEQAGIIYEQFGEGISDKFKTGVEEARSEFQKFNFELTKASKLDKIELPSELSGNIKGQVDNIADSARQSIEEKKESVQKSIKDMFAIDGVTDDSEQKVIDILSKGSDAKLTKVNEIQQQIYDTWNNAIQEHGKLSEEDVEKIREYIQQIEQLKLEAKAENNSDWFDLKEKTKGRVNGLSLQDAGKEYQESNNQLKDMFSSKRAIYANGIDQLKQSQKDLISQDAEGNKAEIDTIQKQIDDKQNKYNQLISQERDKRKELLDVMYEMNPKLKGNMNEIDGSELSGEDKNAQARIYDLEKTYSKLSNVTKTGMQQLQDSTGAWRDVYVEVDDATGNIIGVYDTYTGKMGGYTQKNLEAMEKMKSDTEKGWKQIQNLFSNPGSFNSSVIDGATASIENLGNGLGNLKINGSVIGQLQNVKQELDGTMTAITTINGQQVTIKADTNGVITNLDEIAHQLNLIDKDITIHVNEDGTIEKVKASSEEVEKHIKEMGNHEVALGINDDGSIDEAKDELDSLNMDYEELDKKYPDIGVNDDGSIDNTKNDLKETKEFADELDGSNPTIETNADTGEADSNLDSTKEKADELDNTNPEVDVEANTGEADSNLDTTTQKADDLSNKDISNTVHIDTSQANSGLQGIIDKISYIISHPIDSFANFVSGGNAYATGTNNAKKGRALTGEEGMELLVHPQVRNLKGGEVILNNKSTKQYLEAMRIHDAETEGKIGHNKSGTKRWRGGLTWINEGMKGELVNLPNGTQIIPHDLSEKMIEENADNNGMTQVFNNINYNSISRNQDNIYTTNRNKAQKISVNTANTIDKPYEDDEWEEKDTTYMEEAERKAYESAKKQFEIKKKAKEKEEKILKDKIDKEKQYLDDISSEWEINTQAIGNSMDDLALREKEYGANITISQKLDILNSKWQNQSSLLPVAESQLKTYRETTVTTAEAQEELNKHIQTATENYNKQKQAIADAYNELVKYKRESLGNLRTDLANAILDDLKKKADKEEERRDKAEKKAKQALQDEKEAKIKQYDDRIKALQDQLKALDDDTEDKQKKLQALLRERELWRKDNSVFSKKKQQDLDTQIADLEKQIKKDDIQKQIDNLNDKKQNESDSYDKRIKDLDDFYEKQKEKTKKANDDDLIEKKAYAKADELLKEKNMNRILEIMQSKSEDFKDVGYLLGDNFAQALSSRIEDSVKVMDDLLGANGKWVADVGDHVKIGSNTDERIFSDPTGGGVKGSFSDLGVGSDEEMIATNYNNGFLFLRTASGKNIGWVDRHKLAKFSSGGRTPSNIDDGALSVLHSNEAVLNANDTKKLDDIGAVANSLKSFVEKIDTGKLALVVNGVADNQINGLNNLSNLSNQSVVNNSNNNQTVNFNMTNNITNNTPQDVAMNERSFARMADRWVKSQGRIFK